VLLKCKETQRCRENFFDNKWLHITEEIALKNTITYAKITELKFLGKFLYKCKLENQVGKNCAQFNG
jgi:hypothetical protein